MVKCEPRLPWLFESSVAWIWVVVDPLVDVFLFLPRGGVGLRARLRHPSCHPFWLSADSLFPFPSLACPRALRGWLAWRFAFCFFSCACAGVRPACCVQWLNTHVHLGHFIQTTCAAGRARSMRDACVRASRAHVVIAVSTHGGSAHVALGRWHPHTYSVIRAWRLHSQLIVGNPHGKEGCHPSRSVIHAVMPPGVPYVPHMEV